METILNFLITIISSKIVWCIGFAFLLMYIYYKLANRRFIKKFKISADETLFFPVDFYGCKLALSDAAITAGFALENKRLFAQDFSFNKKGELFLPFRYYPALLGKHRLVLDTSVVYEIKSQIRNTLIVDVPNNFYFMYSQTEFKKTSEMGFLPFSTSPYNYNCLPKLSVGDKFKLVKEDGQIKIQKI